MLALNDGDGDGLFDGLDNCVETFNPDQADTDGDGVGDVCQVVEAYCGDGAIGPDEVCDDGSRNGACNDLSYAQCKALGAARSFCDASCKPVVFVDVSEAAVNPNKEGVLPAVLFGSPYLNLGAARRNDGVPCALPAGCPADMLDPATIRLEGLRAGAACSGNGAPIQRSTTGDTNGDGIADLTLKFEVKKASIAKGDNEACTTGVIRPVVDRFPGAPFESRDHLNVK
jgi:hypothetical protein